MPIHQRLIVVPDSPGKHCQCQLTIANLFRKTVNSLTLHNLVLCFFRFYGNYRRFLPETPRSAISANVADRGYNSKSDKNLSSGGWKAAAFRLYIPSHLRSFLPIQGEMHQLPPLFVSRLHLDAETDTVEFHGKAGYPFPAGYSLLDKSL